MASKAIVEQLEGNPQALQQYLESLERMVNAVPLPEAKVHFRTIKGTSGHNKGKGRTTKQPVTPHLKRNNSGKVKVIFHRETREELLAKLNKLSAKAKEQPK